MPIHRTALALVSLALLTTAASAQTGTGIIPPAGVPDQNCLVGGQRGSGLTQIATNCPIGRIPALQSFRFGFFNGDHRFRQATLMPNGETFEAAWADSGGEDPYFVEARWRRVPEAPGGVVTAVVQGVADIPIPVGPANSTLVLSGFEFKRADGTDNNVRTIAIQTDSARRMIRTVLLDDQGADYTNLATAIAVGFAFGAAGAPDPNMSFAATGISNSLLSNGAQRLTPGTPAYEAIPAERPAATTASGPLITLPAGAITIRPGSIPATAAPTVHVSDTRARPYRVRVAYLWVPNNRLARTRQASGSGRTAAESSGSLPGATPHVLHGFSFHFGNSDHFIGGFGVHLAGGAPVQTAVPSNEIVTWEDANRDDPISWSVRFSELVNAPAASAAGMTVRAPTAAVTTTTTTTTPAGSSSSESSSTPPPEEETPRRGRRRGE
jgi:hypothetical protein